MSLLLSTRLNGSSMAPKDGILVDEHTDWFKSVWTHHTLASRIIAGSVNSYVDCPHRVASGADIFYG
jgi:hypothetical protein